MKETTKMSQTLTLTQLEIAVYATLRAMLENWLTENEFKSRRAAYNAAVIALETAQGRN
jgi:hypothetical protein